MIDDEALAGFRATFRSWLGQTVPADWRQRLADDQRALYVWWVSAMRDAGYGPPHWSKEVGGPGLSLAEQLVVYEETTRADCPNYPGLFSCGYGATRAYIQAIRAASFVKWPLVSFALSRASQEN